ncbi:MAG: M48 family metallopeptidase [Blastocatellia bacterium]|nr:M48 family metallopeptidase [Chloracidobacterium sp.]MBL8185388.1 M48 family metallopeptidase [Blastocatellia bacterium]HBE81924.1 peptidase M48 [Blastocatellia bacterium]HRJ88071.1 M48 family metallopeptidase [Pyrinomonadaceae bacterium]HRK51767.1 M48 family metallopeptidase [Pyrinomonadaceae bacterium]
MAKKKSEGESESTAVTKSLFVRCRYCGQRNSVKEGYKNNTANCGKCKLPLSNEPHKKFADLGKHDYIHPADSKALAALRAIPGIDTALKKLLEVTGESAIRVTFMASAVKVTPQQCPDLHAKLQIACTTLGVPMPDLYIQQNPIVNAFTGGVEKPIIVLHSALIERLNEEETLAVIAHEVGHIHAEHVLYLTAAQLILAIATIPLASLPIAGILKELLTATMRGALLAWMRRAELSCDRAALLVVQDPHVVGRTMMKLAGGTFASKINYELFLEQAREFQKNYDQSKLDKFWADIINAGLSHPFPIWRVAEILKWVEGGEYERVLKSK